MRTEQWRRLDVVGKIEEKLMTIAQGAKALGISRRQMKRLRKRVREEGEQGVVHANTGRSPKHRTSDLVVARVIALRRVKYSGFNDQHFTEKLVEEEHIVVSRASVQRWLRDAGIGSPRTRRPGKRFNRRDRRVQAGQMILWDGSRHDWLEGRGPRLCLLGAIDDATGELLPGAHFVEEESTLGYLRVLFEIITRRGVPVSAYMDRHGSLKRNDRNWTVDEELAGHQEPTQVRRALDELGIQVIYAMSPQAKGRVERLWGVLQDRLCSELRLANVTTIDEANALLNAYRPRHNKRFAIHAADERTAWRDCPPGLSADDACALVYARKVANDHTVCIDGKTIALTPARGRKRGSYAKALVTIRHQLNGVYRVFLGDDLIATADGVPPRGPNRTRRSVAAWRRNENAKAERKRRDANNVEGD